jgi:hypothetical protein
MGYLSETVDNLDLIDRMDGRRQPSVYAEYLVIYHHTQGEEVEHVCEVVPDVGVAIFPSALRVEPVRLCNAS